MNTIPLTRTAEVGGEGTAWILLFLVFLIIIVVSVVAYKLWKHKKSVYTYEYRKK